MSNKDRPSVDGLYEAILNSMYCTVDADGRIIHEMVKEPFKINDKDVVLPTKELLVENNWEKRHPFHPLSEDILMGQSPTIHFLIKRVTAGLTLRISTLMSSMLAVAASTDLQGRLQDGAYVAFLEPANHAKTSTVNGWGKVMSSFKTTQFLSMYVARAKVIGDKPFLRVANIASPYLEDTTDDVMLCGVKLNSKADKRMIVALLRSLLPEKLLEVGCNGNVPYFESILTLHRNIHKHLNDVVKPFKPLANELDGFKPFKLDWWKWVKDNGLEQFIGLIPALPGNEGEAELGRGPEKEPDPELVALAGRTNISARKRDENSPPWSEENPVPRAVEKATTGGGINIMVGDDENDRNRRDDRDRGRRSDRDDIPRVDIFGSDRRSRRDDRYDDRYDDRRNDRRSDRYDDRGRDSGGGIDIMGGGGRRR